MSNITLTFVFGNCNKFTFDVPRKTLVAQLYVAAKTVVEDNILYLMCGAKVLGVDDMKKTLVELNCFLRNRQTISIVLKHPKTNYCDDDLVVHNYIKYIEQQTQSAISRSVNIFNELMPSHIVHINESDYGSYVSSVSLAEIDETTCVICHEDFETDDIIDQMMCGHSFHRNCLRPLLTTNSVQCPVCSYDVREGSPNV